MKDSRELTHIDSEGRPRMVDVSEKEQTTRRAVATEQIKALVRALRGSSEPTALALANDFEVLASRH